jgi:hypothetical protein
MIKLKVGHYYRFTYTDTKTINYIHIKEIHGNTIVVSGYRVLYLPPKDSIIIEIKDSQNITWDLDCDTRKVEEITKGEFESGRFYEVL